MNCVTLFNKHTETKDMSFSAMSLFSGMGGDSLGIKNAGGNIVAYSEFWNKARESHDLNFPNCTLLQNMNEKPKDQTNIQKLTDAQFEEYHNEVDLIFAGFPCQPFSQAGKKKVDDPRNTLFHDFVRATKLVNPKYVVGENVNGLLSRKTADGSLFIDVIKAEFERIGYTIHYKVCSAEQYNVPQKRKRLIIVGIRNDVDQVFTFPEGNDTNNGLENIIKFDMEGTIKIDEDDFDMTSLPAECIVTDMNNTENEDTENIHPYLRLKAKTRNQSWGDKTHKSTLSFGKRDSPIHAEIVDIRKPAKTIICTYDHQPRLFVPLRNSNGYYLRCILPDELKQIQGFPPDYQLSGNKKDKIKQIGNAVPPPLIEAIVRALV